jgi:uncharacterized protein (TIGR03000 family)
MYSVVLMAALTTGVDVPDFGRRGGCHGCWGGCYGCYGGCYGGCWGGCRGGCWGGCYGCWGGWGGWGGCYGGCYGGYALGGWGGGWGGMGGYVYAPTVATYATPVLASATLPSMNTVTSSMYYSPNTNTNNRATIVVHLPANAKLSVDGKATNSTSNTRRFYSPPLEPGKDYHYVFRAEVERDGKPVPITKRVDVRAGETRDISLTLPDTEEAADRSTPRDGVPERRVRSEKP